MLRPSDVEEVTSALGRARARHLARSSRTDVSNDFTLSEADNVFVRAVVFNADDPADLDASVLRKIDFFAHHVVRAAQRKCSMSAVAGSPAVCRKRIAPGGPSV